MTTGITDVEWLDAKVCELSDSLDRLTASLAAKEVEVKGLRAGIENIEILLDVDGDSPTPEEVGAAHKEALRLLSQSPADLLARREAERKVIEAALNWHAEHLSLGPGKLRHLCQAICALAALAEQEAKGPHGG